MAKTDQRAFGATLTDGQMTGNAAADQNVRGISSSFDMTCPVRGAIAAGGNAK
jgi:hypothetical protein